MSTTSHQIETVLRTYHKQLRLERINQSSENKRAQNIDDLVTISLEGKEKQLASEPVEIKEKQRHIAETAPNEEEDSQNRFGISQTQEDYPISK